MNRPVQRLAAILLLSALAGTACGQKPGVHVATIGAQGSGDLSLGAEGELGVAGEGEVGSSDAAGGQGSTAAGGGGTSGSADRPGGPADRTGVSDKEIIVGLHAPVTGAAPFPATSFERGKEVYWKWSGAPSIHGRKIRLKFEDDQYNPFTALDRCRKLAEQSKAFLLVGGGGTDQIQACARWATSKTIPYLSAGVTEVGMRNLSSYFAISMSYPQQAPLLVQLIQKDARLAPLTKVAMVRTNTPNFEDARQAFIKALDGSGKQLVFDRSLSKNPSATEYDDTARALALSEAEIVFVLIAPVHYVQLTSASRLPANYRPWWVGVGITKGLNDVLATGCSTSANAIDKGLFFSPFPGLDAAGEMDPNYNRAYREIHGTDGDDLGLALWGLNKTLHRLLENAGGELSRQSFLAATQTAQIETGVFPSLRYTAQNHFGADSVHLLKANCSTRRHETNARFARGF